jgi:hypothetical protein
MMNDLTEILDDLDALNTQQNSIEEDSEIMEQRIQHLEFEVERLVFPNFIIMHLDFKFSVHRLKTKQIELERKIARLEYRRRLRSSQ